MESKELKNEVESLLFSTGRKMDIEEISNLLSHPKEELQKALELLKKDYDERHSSMVIVRDGNIWKLGVRAKYQDVVRKIVSETELSRTVTETLAIVAWKAPCLQADIIKIRTNKAYDHIKELVELGYVTKQKHGRTMLIRLSQKFYDYFDLPHEKIKSMFAKFKDLEKDIIKKEEEIDKQKEELKKKEEEFKKRKQEEANAPEVKVYDLEKEQAKTEIEKPEVETYEDKLGELEIVEEVSEEERKESAKAEVGGKSAKAESPEEEGLPDIDKEELASRLGRKLPEQIKKKVHKRVKEITGTELEEETKEEPEETEKGE